MKLITKATPIFDRTIGLLSLFAGILILFIMLSVTAEVATRYFLGSMMGWVIEVSEYSLLFITFLATAWVLKKERHVKMELVLRRLNPRTQSLLNIITSIIGAIICLIVAWYGVKVTWGSYQIGYIMAKPLRVPQFLILFIIPVGSFLLFIQFLRRTYGYLGHWKELPNKESGL